AYSAYTVNGLIRLTDRIAGEFLRKEKVAEIELTAEEDRQAILNLHDTASEVAERPAYRLLQDSAEKAPEKTALIAVDRTLSYRELNGEANALGRLLREHGAGPETIVGVMADRNSYAYVMREGVLKSGGAFMPIDPEYPEERIRFILEDSGSKLLVTTGNVIGRRKEFIHALQAEGITVLDAVEAVSSGSRENLNVEVPYEALAYVIYTSGSTGKPKGVMLTNKNLVNYADDNKKNYETLAYTEKAGISVAMAAFTFDVSITEEFVPFAHGMTNVLATREQMMDAAQMCGLMVKNHVDVINGTPSYFMNMIEIEAFAPAVRGLKAIDVGAEAFPPALFEKLRALNPDLYIVNTYGPTEATVSCTLKEVTRSDDITIGGPLANVTMATMDRNGKLQPLGAMGELVIMGDGVGRGYIGREDLNRKNFIRLLGMPAYRSGDLVRIREDGDIEFHGRMDDQVKLRGLRVELGEVQNVIGTYPGIRSNVVVVAHGETDYLAAYFTADEPVDVADLKAHISRYLTAYMVPQAFMQLDAMPMTANGKVDKKALPPVTFTEEELAAPENETQAALVDIAKELTGTDRIGITTDLFMAGLSSIGCIKLCSLLSEAFGVTVRV
ncbi:MAG: non-ribosomal peptide synthetase, partial [Lachnospiraceae bacterium]|nr:non-ribosomal peptide synthetase [Lachnospiraceae bacterium]